MLGIPSLGNALPQSLLTPLKVLPPMSVSLRLNLLVLTRALVLGLGPTLISVTPS